MSHTPMSHTPVSLKPVTNTVDDLDLIFVGGGLAALLAAYRIRRNHPDCKLAIFERAPAIAGHHTWSFHASDVTAEALAWLRPFIAHSWTGQSVRFPGYERYFTAAYHSITSESLAAGVMDLLRDSIHTGLSVETLSPTRLTLSDGREITARAVIDARGADPNLACPVAFQKFLGLFWQTPEPHGLTHPVIMDADIPQTDGYRFIYLLPLSADTVLIEDTYYSDTPGLDAASTTAGVEAYAAAQGWGAGRAIGTEQGVLPIILAGEFNTVWPISDQDQPRLGMRAGLFHPTTGYSLPLAVQMADRLAAQPRFDAASLAPLLRKAAARNWREGAYLRALNRMLFLGAQGAERRVIFERFYTLSEGLIARFYAGQLKIYDKLRIVTGKPPIPILNGLKSLPPQSADGFNDDTAR